MKTQLQSVAELGQEIDRLAALKKDFVVPTQHLRMELQADDEKMTPVLSFKNGEQHNLQVNEVAHKQIATCLDIPTKYYNRLRSDAPHLLADNVNHWFNANPEKRLIRTIDGTARAFLSNRYQRIENEQIARMVLPVLMDQPDLQIVSLAITQERMHIKAVFPRLSGEVVKGDVVQAGVSISNSEVGMGAVKVEPLVYRLVCLNGMILNDSKYTARHVGGLLSQEEGIQEMLTDETKAADDTAILLKTRDVVRASFNEIVFRKQLTLMQDSTQQRIEGNPVEAVEVLAKTYRLSEGEKGGVLRNLIEGHDLSRWGVINAVTAEANVTADYSRATELETLGGQLLAMTAAQFRPILMAA